MIHIRRHLVFEMQNFLSPLKEKTGPLVFVWNIYNLTASAFAGNLCIAKNVRQTGGAYFTTTISCSNTWNK
jgi:hypothetical protein